MTDRRRLIISWSDEGSKDYVSVYPLTPTLADLGNRLLAADRLVGHLEEVIDAIMAKPPVRDLNREDIIVHSVVIASDIELAVC